MKIVSNFRGNLPPPSAMNKETPGASVTSVLCYQYTRPHTPNNNNS